MVGSIKGAPGVTTAVLALAAAWPERADGGVRPVVVEADVSGGDLAVRFGVPHTPGLLDVATSARKERPGSLLAATTELPFGVRAVASPAGGRACTEAVRVVAGSVQRVLLGDQGDRGTVVLDVGRIGKDAEGLLEAAEAVVLVARGGADALAHAYAYLAEAGPRAERHVLAVVGPCPYAAGEITATLGVSRVVFLPWDTKAADALAGKTHSALRTSGWRALRLMTAAGDWARQLNGTGEVAVKGLSGALAGLGPVPAPGGHLRRGLAGLATKESQS
ncbi:MinD/ParA family protein [Streptomyces sp. NPDC059426]|uniref:MinD/ParA family ATP-binding protein n=1 Tax=Streptomyces sp. NPDC059426 TaxID=3346827 RepID=UPI003673FCC7